MKWISVTKQLPRLDIDPHAPASIENHDRYPTYYSPWVLLNTNLGYRVARLEVGPKFRFPSGPRWVGPEMHPYVIVTHWTYIPEMPNE